MKGSARDANASFEVFVLTYFQSGHAGITWPTPRVSWTKRSDRWATRPAMSSTHHWTQPSVPKTATVWRRKNLRRSAGRRAGCTNAASGGTKPSATSAGISGEKQQGDEITFSGFAARFHIAPIPLAMALQWPNLMRLQLNTILDPNYQAMTSRGFSKPCRVG